MRRDGSTAPCMSRAPLGTSCHSIACPPGPACGLKRSSWYDTPLSSSLSLPSSGPRWNQRIGLTSVSSKNATCLPSSITRSEKGYCPGGRPSLNDRVRGRVVTSECSRSAKRAGSSGEHCSSFMKVPSTRPCIVCSAWTRMTISRGIDSPVSRLPDGKVIDTSYPSVRVMLSK